LLFRRRETNLTTVAFASADLRRRTTEPSHQGRRPTSPLSSPVRALFRTPFPLWSTFRKPKCLILFACFNKPKTQAGPIMDLWALVKTNMNFQIFQLINIYVLMNFVLI
jgi:hypothetical protein